MLASVSVELLLTADGEKRTRPATQPRTAEQESRCPRTRELTRTNFEIDQNLNIMVNDLTHRVLNEHLSYTIDTDLLYIFIFEPCGAR